MASQESALPSGLLPQQDGRAQTYERTSVRCGRDRALRFRAGSR